MRKPTQKKENRSKIVEKNDKQDVQNLVKGFENLTGSNDDRKKENLLLCLKVKKSDTMRCAANLDSPKPRMSLKVQKNLSKIVKKTSPNETALTLQKTNQISKISKISVPTQPGRLSQNLSESVGQSELERQNGDRTRLELKKKQ